ncbi:MAG TPA: site-2 protease family protein [archaeon]|nr:site-2 protease family protein [archaeon]
MKTKIETGKRIGIFSYTEIRDIIIAVFSLTIILAYPDFGNIFLVFITVIVAFLLHELAHKFAAMKFNAVAFFKLWPEGLLVGFVTLLLPFRFIAPGAVVIQPYRYGRWGYREMHLTPSEVGIISAVGPIVNIFFAFVFGLAGIPGLDFVARINSYLALFNLLPINPLDGNKVFQWKPWLWIFLLGVSLLTFLL